MSNITKLSPDVDEKKYNFTDYDKTLHWVMKVGAPRSFS